MSIATCWMALCWPLCHSNSAANAFQTGESVPGVANSTLLATKSANTLRWLFPLRRFISSAPTHNTLLELNLAWTAFPWAKSIHYIRDVALAKDLAGALDRHLTHQGHCGGLKLLDEMLATPFPGSDGVKTNEIRRFQNHHSEKLNSPSMQRQLVGCRSNF
jgi:hypothetical protein